MGAEQIISVAEQEKLYEAYWYDATRTSVSVLCSLLAIHEENIATFQEDVEGYEDYQRFIDVGKRCLERWSELPTSII